MYIIIGPSNAVSSAKTTNIHIPAVIPNMTITSDLQSVSCVVTEIEPTQKSLASFKKNNQDKFMNIRISTGLHRGQLTSSI